MDKLKKILLFRIPMSICNFRCHYCYLAQRPVHYEGIQPEMQYTPEEVAYAIRPERIGGKAYINLCADGETLLVKNIDRYVEKMLEAGHYVEFVTNMTVTPMLEKILQIREDLLKHLEFKCSFHYLWLKKHGKLDLFAENVNKAWRAGTSCNIEITPSDELIPYIDEVKEFSIKNFGALPHLTIARDDRTEGIEYLTSLPIKEYDEIWSQFDSEFWRFKKTIFGKRQTTFCYAGSWSIYADLTTGNARACYCGEEDMNIFENPDSPFPQNPIGNCPIAHCYNGHALLTLGLIPGTNDTRYGDIRDRRRVDGSCWLQPELKAFFNCKLEDNNDEVGSLIKLDYKLKSTYRKFRGIGGRVKRKVLGK